jgi:hypothetical protein
MNVPADSNQKDALMTACPKCHGISTVDPDPDCNVCGGEGEIEISLVPDWREIARVLYQALNGIYMEEINGRLCPLPDAPEVRCCESCRRHWDRTRDAVDAYTEAARA